MNADFILKQIMSDQQEGLTGFNIANLVDGLLDLLNKREQEVVKSRFGLGGQDRTTLEAIGRKHQLTRERVRQIETSSIAKIKKSKEAENVIAVLEKLLSALISEHAGLISKAYLFDLLYHLSDEQGLTDRLAHDRYVDFALSKLLDEKLDLIKRHQFLGESVKSKSLNLDHIEKVAEELLSHVKNLRQLLATEEALKLIESLDSYQQSAEKLMPQNQLDLKDLLLKVVPDFSDSVYEKRVLYNLLKSISELEQNRFHAWGHKKWREVSPKTINDKIYLVLKNAGQPMYYGDIAKKIAEMSFDEKDVNVATTHNELILDDKYVLVGRGLYGLKEWGYKSGTVTDIIVDILRKAGKPLSKEDILTEVAKQRLVKQTTVNLALMNKTYFKKNDGFYTLAA